MKVYNLMPDIIEDDGSLHLEVILRISAAEWDIIKASLRPGVTPPMFADDARAIAVPIVETIIYLENNNV